jgi:hypothetical protein
MLSFLPKLTVAWPNEKFSIKKLLVKAGDESEPENKTNFDEKNFSSFAFSNLLAKLVCKFINGKNERRSFGAFSLLTISGAVVELDFFFFYLCIHNILCDVYIFFFFKIERRMK